MRLASQRIARYAASPLATASAMDLSREVGRALIDTVGVALAGRSEPVSEIAWRYGMAGGGQGAQGWGRRGSVSLEAAAFYNGVAGHVLDYDDVSSPLRGHPSIALLPPLVALAQQRDLTGAQLVQAYVLGFEVMVRLARVMVQDHYAKGWHATTTLGVIGAAVACSQMLRLSETAIAHAIGIAVAQAAGSRINFGTMSKSFQAGHCAASGLRAALLAELGMDAAPDALDGDQGFMRLYAEGQSLDAAFDTLGEAVPELASSGIEIKKYPMCYAAHRTLDGILDLQQEHGLQAVDVQAVHVTSNYRGMVPLVHDCPQTGLEGKFSMQYAVAAALMDGRVSLSSFTDAAVRRPEIQRLMLRVTRREDSTPTSERWNHVQVQLQSGRVVEKRITQLRGSKALPLSDDGLLAKWRDCLQYGSVAGIQADDFARQAMRLEDCTVRDLMQSLAVV